MTILNKKQMSEEDIKLNYITPSVQKEWKDHITMETFGWNLLKKEKSHTPMLKLGVGADQEHNLLAPGHTLTFYYITISNKCQVISRVKFSREFFMSNFRSP